MPALTRLDRRAIRSQMADRVGDLEQTVEREVEAPGWSSRTRGSSSRLMRYCRSRDLLREGLRGIELGGAVVCLWILASSIRYGLSAMEVKERSSEKEGVRSMLYQHCVVYSVLHASFELGRWKRHRRLR